MALLGQLITVQRGGRRGRCSGGMANDRSDGAAIHARGVDGRDHDPSRYRAHGKGDGDQQRDADGRTDAGDDADEHSAENTDGKGDEDLKGGKGGKGSQYVLPHLYTALLN